MCFECFFCDSFILVGEKVINCFDKFEGNDVEIVKIL